MDGKLCWNIPEVNSHSKTMRRQVEQWRKFDIKLSNGLLCGSEEALSCSTFQHQAIITEGAGPHSAEGISKKDREGENKGT